jgi:hypothetical protein
MGERTKIFNFQNGTHRILGNGTWEILIFEYEIASTPMTLGSECQRRWEASGLQYRWWPGLI